MPQGAEFSQLSESTRVSHLKNHETQQNEYGLKPLGLVVVTQPWITAARALTADAQAWILEGSGNSDNQSLPKKGLSREPQPCTPWL